MICDVDGKCLKKGRVYRIASSFSPNRFRCTKGGTPNGGYFRRVRDNHVHRAREFVEFRNGCPYYDLMEVEHGE